MSISFSCNFRVSSGKKRDSEVSAKPAEDKTKDSDLAKQEPVTPSKDTKEDKDATKSESTHSQWSPKDKRDNSCPGNVETGGNQKEQSKMPSSRSFTNSSKSVTGDDAGETNENSKSDSTSTECQSKDPRVERKIRNKVFLKSTKTLPSISVFCFYSIIFSIKNLNVSKNSYAF